MNLRYGPPKHVSPSAARTSSTDNDNGRSADSSRKVSSKQIKRQRVKKIKMKQLRSAGLELLDSVMSKHSISSAIRRLEFPDVRNGEAAVKDLARSGLHINGIRSDAICELLVESSANDLSATKYPTKELCDQLGMSVDKYKSEFDPFGHRALAASVLNGLITSAAEKSGTPVSQVSPILIEELITTLSQAGVVGFPPCEVQVCGHALVDRVVPRGQEHIYMAVEPPKNTVNSRGVYIQVKSADELRVYSHMSPVPWVGGYAAAHLSYDILVDPTSRRIQYRNAAAFVALPGAENPVPDAALCSRIPDEAMTSPSQYLEKIAPVYTSVPKTLPGSGVVVKWDLPDEEIVVTEMLYVQPKVGITRPAIAASKPEISQADVHDARKKCLEAVFGVGVDAKEYTHEDVDTKPSRISKVLNSIKRSVLECVVASIKLMGPKDRPKIIKSIKSVLRKVADYIKSVASKVKNLVMGALRKTQRSSESSVPRVNVPEQQNHSPELNKAAETAADASVARQCRVENSSIAENGTDVVKAATITVKIAAQAASKGEEITGGHGDTPHADSSSIVMNGDGPSARITVNDNNNNNFVEHVAAESRNSAPLGR